MWAWEPIWNSIAFMILWISESFSLYLLVKNSFNFKVGFFSYVEHISRVSSGKSFYVQITIVPRHIDAKKTRKNFHKLHMSFFSLCLAVNSSLLWAFVIQNFWKIYFEGIKVEKWHSCNKNHLFFAKNSPELQVFMS